MTPRLSHSIFVLFTAVLLSAFVMSHSALAAERPNIVLLLTDDHPWNEYGFMGSKVAHTPNIDRLASQSLRFPQGYVTAPVCRPSLSTILTGRYPHETGIVFNASPRQKEDNNAAHLITKWPTLPGLLQRAGYASLQTGKHWEADYQTAGFTEGTSAYTAAGRRNSFNGTTMEKGEIGRDTMQPIHDFVDKHSASGTPFFIWYGVYLPHAPANAPQKYRDLFAGKGLKDYEVAYHANIAWLDDTIGDLIGYLDAKDLTKNTLFFLISDNGMTIHPDPWWGGPGGKTSIAEMGLRTPFLVRWDGKVAPGDYDHPVSSIDLVPTLLTAAGVDFSDAKLPGLDLVALAKAGPPATPRPVFCENFNPNPKVTGTPEETVVHRSVRLGDYKLISPENTDNHAAITKGWPKPDVKAPTSSLTSASSTSPPIRRRKRTSPTTPPTPRNATNSSPCSTSGGRSNGNRRPHSMTPKLHHSILCALCVLCGFTRAAELVPVSLPPPANLCRPSSPPGSPWRKSRSASASMPPPARATWCPASVTGSSSSLAADCPATTSAAAPLKWKARSSPPTSYWAA